MDSFCLRCPNPTFILCKLAEALIHKQQVDISKMDDRVCNIIFIEFSRLFTQHYS